MIPTFVILKQSLKLALRLPTLVVLAFAGNILAMQILMYAMVTVFGEAITLGTPQERLQVLTSGFSDFFQRDQLMGLTLGVSLMLVVSFAVSTLIRTSILTAILHRLRGYPILGKPLGGLLQGFTQLFLRLAILGVIFTVALILPLIIFIFGLVSAGTGFLLDAEGAALNAWPAALGGATAIVAYLAIESARFISMSKAALSPQKTLSNQVSFSIAFLAKNAVALFSLASLLLLCAFSGLIILSLVLAPFASMGNTGSALAETLLALGSSYLQIAAWAALIMLVENRSYFQLPPPSAVVPHELSEGDDEPQPEPLPHNVFRMSDYFPPPDE